VDTKPIHTKLKNKGTNVVLEGKRAEAMDGTIEDLFAKIDDWLDISLSFAKAKEIKRSPVEMIGKYIKH
jgi:hypothetical protein